MKLSAITGNRQSLPVRFGDGVDAPVAQITYDPVGYTPALESEFEEIARSQFQQRALVLFITRVIVEWDLERDVKDEHGNVTGAEPVPLTMEAVAEVPTVVLTRLISAIREHAMPSSEEGKASGAGSPQQATSEGSLSGTS